MAVWDSMGPAYNPATWSLGYFAQQPGQAGANAVVQSVLPSLFDPPDEMVEAATIVENQADDTQ